MSLTGIISVSGLPGLHKVLTHTKTGLIVESLQDGRRRPIYASQKVSALEDISIYTVSEDKPLADIFKLMRDKEGGKQTLNHKSDPSELRAYLTALVDDIDHDRVYNSDIAKLFQWYNTLAEKELLVFEKDITEEEVEEAKKAKTEEKKAPAKKPAAKKPAASKAKEAAKPKASAAKKAAPKKTANKKT